MFLSICVYIYIYWEGQEGQEGQEVKFCFKKTIILFLPENQFIG